MSVFPYEAIMSNKISFTALGIALLALLALFVRPVHAPAASANGAYERVIRSGTLRCAYAFYPPFLSANPNDGKLKGVMADVMVEFAKASGLKVEWGPEIDWSDIAATLETGKADAFCAGMFMTPARGRVIAGTVPLYFATAEAYVRPDDRRFDNNVDRINQDDVRIAVNPGDLSEEVARRSFPKAQRIDKGPLGGEAQLFMDVAANKADLTISGPSNVFAYNQNNPVAILRKVEFQHPLMSFPIIVGVEIHETALLHLLDASLRNIIDNGMADRILKANAGADYGTAYVPAKPQFN